MKIIVKCRCGCEATFDDTGESMMALEQEQEKEGLSRWVDVKAQEWQKIHALCILKFEDEKQEEHPYPLKRLAEVRSVLVSWEDIATKGATDEDLNLFYTELGTAMTKELGEN